VWPTCAACGGSHPCSPTPSWTDLRPRCRRVARGTPPIADGAGCHLDYASHRPVAAQAAPEDSCGAFWKMLQVFVLYSLSSNLSVTSALSTLPQSPPPRQRLLTPQACCGAPACVPRPLTRGRGPGRAPWRVSVEAGGVCDDDDASRRGPPPLTV